MKYQEMKKLFSTIEGEFLKFDRVENKSSNRPDVHAFLLLDRLVPGSTDMISASEHDEIFLDVGVEELASVITKDQVIELIRCGVRLNTEYDCLAMFT